MIKTLMGRPGPSPTERSTIMVLHDRGLSVRAITKDPEIKWMKSTVGRVVHEELVKRRQEGRNGADSASSVAVDNDGAPKQSLELADNINVQEVEQSIKKRTPKRLSAHQEQQAGTRAHPLLLANQHQGFAVRLAKAPDGTPDYIDDPAECYTRCVKGFRFGQSHQGQTVEPYCTNKSCWERKVGAGKKTRTAQLRQTKLAQDSHDEKIVERLVESIGTRSLAVAIITALIHAEPRELFHEIWPGAEKDFAYEPGNITKLKKRLGIEHVDRTDPWQQPLMLTRLDIFIALDDASEDAATEAAARLMVHLLRHLHHNRELLKVMADGG